MSELRSVSRMSDDDLHRRVRLVDPLSEDNEACRPADLTGLIESVFAQTSPPAGRHVSQPRFRPMLIVAVGVAVLLVPAALAFHRQIVQLFQQSAGELKGSYSASVSGLEPANL